MSHIIQDLDPNGCYPTRVHMCSGSEGPAHDPYGWNCMTVYRNGHEYELDLHALAPSTLTIDGELVFTAMSDNECKELMERFERATGASRHSWEAWHYRSHSRCKCGCKKFVSMRGYPGESFDVCASCGSFVNSYFNESAII